MSEAEHDQLKEEIRAAVERALNSRINKLTYAVWSMVLGGVGALVFLGIQWGEIRTEVTNHAVEMAKHESNTDLHMPANDKFKTFISRTEYLAIKSEREKSLDKTLTELKAAILRLDEKVGRISH